MATVKTVDPWRDPRTGVLYFWRRIPARFRSVAGYRADTIKVSLGTSDAKRIGKPWADALAAWARKEAEWERKLRAVALTPEGARDIAAAWVARVAAGEIILPASGQGSDIFEPLNMPEERTPERLAAMWELVEAIAGQAAEMADVEVTPETWPVLVQVMAPVAHGAYLDADLRGMGVTVPAVLRPLDALKASLPPVAFAPAPKPATAAVALLTLFEAWHATATVKPRTATETRYILEMLIAHLGHDDAASMTREDLAGWRDAAKEAGRSNVTWNNRLSLVRQVFAWGVSEGRLATNPAENSLRLKKGRVAVRLPYSDADTRRILMAARGETSGVLRWAHWIMAFTGMRVGEVLQLSASDVRQEDGLWFLAVHEDDADKSVKTGQRRNVPIHDALVREGLLDYAQSVPGDGPLFPEKALDKHGHRGGQGWNVVGVWVREVVGITDPAKAPNHAWRHRMEDELRSVEVPEDARDAILGHARKTTGRHYGVRGEALKRLHRELARLPVPAGLDC
ncbi:MAG: tyrosine-type recombinase/integrase [Janthinobacterium lividum]